MEQNTGKFVGPAEIEIIINNWKTHAPKLRGKKKKKLYIYKQMCRDMKKTYKIVLTAVELRKQINLLTNRYRMEKQKITCAGVPSDWEYFDQINDFMEETVCTSEPADPISSPLSPSSSSSTIVETSSDDMASAHKTENCNASLPELQKKLEKAYKNCLKKCLENDKKLVNLLTVILDKNKTKINKD